MVRSRLSQPELLNVIGVLPNPPAAHELCGVARSRRVARAAPSLLLVVNKTGYILLAYAPFSLSVWAGCQHNVWILGHCLFGCWGLECADRTGCFAPKLGLYALGHKIKTTCIAALCRHSEYRIPMYWHALLIKCQLIYLIWYPDAFIWFFFKQVMQFSRFAPPGPWGITKNDVGQFRLRLKHIPIRIPQLPCPCPLLDKHDKHYNGRVGGGRGPSISILSMEHPHVYIIKRFERHVPARVQRWTCFFFNTYSSRTPVWRIPSSGCDSRKAF